MEFKDYFTRQADEYPKYRPHYPSELFRYLASSVPSRRRAWDCATGSGQAALGLLPFFDQVIATDASSRQIANAAGHPRILYAVAPAERTEIEFHSIDLIVVAQAVHWFDFESFYEETRRVLKPEGVIAVWCYSLLRVIPSIDSVVDRFYREVVGSFWPPERKLVDERYDSIPFPFDEWKPPNFSMEATWDLSHLIGYLGTWSSVQEFRKQKNTDPIRLIWDDLLGAWGATATRRKVLWALHMRIGRQR